MADRVGEWPWKGLYSLVAIAGFVLIIQGYGLARQEVVVLYSSPVWFRYVAMLLLLPVFPLLLAAYLPGRIQAAVGHPMLVATQLWAAAHLLTNGSLADVCLFGSFLAWGAANQISMRQRTPRPVFGAPRSSLNDVIALAAGIGIYVAFVLGLHVQITGVPIA